MIAGDLRIVLVTGAALLALVGGASAQQVWIPDVPAYDYNRVIPPTTYVIGCGPTTGAMIMQTYYGRGATNLIPVDALDTARLLHELYMNTDDQGYGAASDFHYGLEEYAYDAGYILDCVLHVEPTTYVPADWSDYRYGLDLMDDATFWDTDTWEILPDDFVDFLAAEVNANRPVSVTVDSNGDGGGDHWMVALGYDQSTNHWCGHNTWQNFKIWYDVESGFTGNVMGLCFVRTIEFKGSYCRWYGDSTTGDGFYGSNPMWLPGHTPASDEVAIYDRAKQYQVSFDSSPTAREVRVEAGDVTFASYMHPRTYTVNGDLRVTGGDLTAWMNVGIAGDLYVDNASTLWMDTGGATLSGASGSTACIGASGGSSGTVLIDYSAHLSGFDEVYVGMYGDGTLTALAGGAIEAGDVYVGRRSGSDSHLTVMDAGSTLTVTGALVVGDEGEGTLYVLNEGVAEAAGCGIAYRAGSTGTAEVSGSGSELYVSGPLYVGSTGNGSLEVSDHAVVTSASGYVGYNGGASGTVDIGTSGEWDNTGDLHVGMVTIEGAGTGDVTISGQGKLVVDNDLIVHLGSTLTAQSGGWVIADTIEDNGGTIDFQAGSVVRTNSLLGFGNAINAHHLEIGMLKGPTWGSHAVGAGQTLTCTGDLTIGVDFSGTLAVSGGGDVSNAYGYVGRYAGGSGMVTVTGAGSTWVNSFLTVGDVGEADLEIRDGGYLYSDSCRVSYQAGSYAEVDVLGENTTWDNPGWLAAGIGGVAAMTVADGGLLDVGGLYLGHTHSAEATTLEITGPGADVQADVLHLGANGWGMVTVDNDGALNTATTYVAREAGSKGSAAVWGGGAWHETGTLYVGGSDAGPGGTALVRVASGGSIRVDGEVFVWGGGTVELLAGVLNTPTIDDTSGGDFSFTGGTLYVRTYRGDLDNYGGTLAPGAPTAPGLRVTHVEGDYTQTGGVLDIDISGAPGGTILLYDRLLADQTVALAGDLDLALTGGYVPVLYDPYLIVSCSTRTGEFYGISGVVVSPQLALAVTYLTDGVRVTPALPGDATLDGRVDAADLSLLAAAWQSGGKNWSTGDLTGDSSVDAADLSLLAANWQAVASPAPVPGPAPLALLAGGGLALLRRRQRRGRR